LVRRAACLGHALVDLRHGLVAAMCATVEM